jgi:hypothetical protein
MPEKNPYTDVRREQHPVKVIQNDPQPTVAAALATARDRSTRRSEHAESCSEQEGEQEEGGGTPRLEDSASHDPGPEKNPSPMGGDAMGGGASRLTGDHGRLAALAGGASAVAGSFRWRPRRSRSTGRRRVGARAFAGSATESGLVSITPRTASGCWRMRPSVVFRSHGSVRAVSRHGRRRPYCRGCSEEARERRRARGRSVAETGRQHRPAAASKGFVAGQRLEGVRFGGSPILTRSATQRLR